MSEYLLIWDSGLGRDMKEGACGIFGERLKGLDTTAGLGEGLAFERYFAGDIIL